jgi:hypothetical protein
MPYTYEFDKLHKLNVVSYQFAKLWVMPTIPFSDPHGKGIDIFV